MTKSQPTNLSSKTSCFRKVILRALVFLGIFLFIVVVSAFIFAEVQTPMFVNDGLVIRNRLSIPPLLEPIIENGEKVFVLSAQQGSRTFLDGQLTTTEGYNGSYLGPTLRAHTGDKIRIRLTNDLEEPITTHWHGMDLPAEMDGGPHQGIQPGDTWQPHWTIANQAATLWYHPHLLHATGKQVYSGLAGFFIIDNENSDALDLPNQYGVDDLPIVVQDREFDEGGQFVFEPDHEDALGPTGMLGDTILVNGTFAPFIEVPANQIRLRLLNGSNARRYIFGFSDNRTFYQISSDGGFLASPVALDRVTLAPGERVEIIVDLSNDTQPLTLLSYAVHEESKVLRFVRTVLQAGRDENQIFNILELRPLPTNESAKPLLQNLNTIERLLPESAVRTRRFTLDPGSRSINGRQMDHEYINEVTRPGDIEIWEIINLSGVYHPFHIHGVQFQILTRNGNPPAENESGWKDTILVPNASIVRVIMRFPDYPNNISAYMYHCHILEHEDMGMMGQFLVTE